MSASKKKLQRREANLSDPVLTEKQKRERKEAAAKKRNTVLAAVAGVVIVALVVVLLVWHSGVFGRATTALTVKDHKYSVADMDYFYRLTVNSAASYDEQMAEFYKQYNMEYTRSFDPAGDLTQQFVDPDAEEPQSYHDYFLEAAKSSLTQYTAWADAAKAEGYQLSEDAQAQLDGAQEDLAQAAKNNNYNSPTAFLKAVYGQNMTPAVYLKNMELYLLATDYRNHIVSSFGNYSDEELEAYYQEYPDVLDSYDYGYAYFDGTAPSTTDDEGNSVPATDEAKAAAMAEAKEEAEAMIADVKAGPSAFPQPSESAEPEPSESAQPSESAEPEPSESAQPSESAESEPSESAQPSQSAEPEPSQEPQEPDYFALAASAHGITSDTVREKVLGSTFKNTAYAEWLMDSARQDGDIEMFEVENTGYYVLQFHARARNDAPTADVRQILISTTPEDDPDTEDVDESQSQPTEEYIEEKRKEAQELLTQFNLGEQTPEAFGELAEEHSEDTRDSENKLQAAGGKYEKISPTSNYVQPWLDWIFAEDRKIGDTGLVQSTYGWHIMYYEAYNDPTWLTQAEAEKKTTDQSDWEERVMEGYEATEGSGYSKVGL